jgi:hypothetical protein
MTNYKDLLAYHEAGHVVVMHAMGYESPGVSVLGSEEDGPYVTNGFAVGDPVLDLMVTLAAGAAAEDLYHESQGTGMRFYTSGICLTDFNQVADLMGEEAWGVEAPEQLIEVECRRMDGSGRSEASPTTTYSVFTVDGLCGLGPERAACQLDGC